MRTILAFLLGFIAGILAVRGMPHDEFTLPNVEPTDWGGWEPMVDYR